MTRKQALRDRIGTNSVGKERVDEIGCVRAARAHHFADADKGVVVEAVGIEPSSEQRVSHDSVAIARKGLDAETALEPSESELRDPLGTRVPNSRRADALLLPVRRAWGALRVV